MTHICVSKLTIIGSDNGLSPGRRQAIIWTNAGILLIGPSGANFSEILIEIDTFSFKKMHLKMMSGNGGHFVSASMSYYTKTWWCIYVRMNWVIIGSGDKLMPSSTNHYLNQCSYVLNQTLRNKLQGYLKQNIMVSLKNCFGNVCKMAAILFTPCSVNCIGGSYFAVITNLISGLETNIIKELGQHHGCWCLLSFCHQATNS